LANAIDLKAMDLEHLCQRDDIPTSGCWKPTLVLLYGIRDWKAAMAELTLDLLGHMIQQVLDNQREMAADIRELKLRVTSLEGTMALIHGDFAGQSLRIDRLEYRLDRIDRRLNIADA
jgi:hypothetical protein